MAVGGAYPAMAPKAIGNYAAQLNALRNKIVVGDLVALPLKRTAQIAIGRVTSEYRYDPTVERDLRHCVGVQWMTTEVPRTAIGQDLLYSRTGRARWWHRHLRRKGPARPRLAATYRAGEVEPDTSGCQHNSRIAGRTHNLRRRPRTTGRLGRADEAGPTGGLNARLQGTGVDSNDLLEAIYNCYDELPEDVRSRLSLQRVWTLVGTA